MNKANSFLKRPITPYIHCSKLNSVLQIIQQIPSLLTTEQDVQSQHNFTNIQSNAFSSIISILDSFEDLFRSCSKDNCVHFLLNTSVSAPLHEISSLRSAAIAPFKQLHQPAISDLFKISDEDLNKQDEVDMKRMAQILIQISNSKRDDISSQINQRFDSLKKIGIECSPDLNCDVVVPNLPKNMNFVIKHSDVELIKQIGKGQSGTVSLGKYKGNEVAVKILYRRALSQPELESFRREIVVLSLLDYPSVLKFYGYTEDPPFYILTDYMPNGSLFDFLRKSPEKLTPTYRTLIALDVARGLKYLHSKNIIHRDMKSLNVLLDSNLRGKICDFGMVRLKQNAPMTGLIGTPHWMAPEVFMSLPTYDEKVDVFSYGILLWELLTNDMPYNGMKQADITIGVTQGTLRPPLPPGPPTKLTKLIQQCWAQDPKDRPTMSQIVAEIEEDSECHFAGTNETLFKSLLSKPKRRSNSSQIINSKKRRSGKRLSEPSKLIDHMDDDDNENEGDITENDLSAFKIANIISQIDASSGSERQKALKNLCECICSDKKVTDEIGKAKNGCKYVSECLSNDELSELCLKNLKKCKSDSVFDVDVLKALLQFSNNENQKLRESALAVLIEAGKLRFDFLVSAPNFLLNLLFFLNKPTSSSLSCALLHLAKKLLKLFVNVPEGIIKILINIYTNSNDQKDVQKDSLKCINTALKFDSIRNEMDEELWGQLLTNESFKESICESFCYDSNQSKSDPIFLKKFFNLQSKIIEANLPKILNNSRFSSALFTIFPIKDSKKKDSNESDTEKSSSKSKQASIVYKTIIKSCSWLLPKIVSEVLEFYQMSAYFIKHHKIEFICDELKKYFISNIINMKLLLKSKLCESLFDAYLEATKADELLLIMSIIYQILTSITNGQKESDGILSFLRSNAKSEANLFLIMNSPLLLQKMFVLLFCEKEIYRLPSFLCISAIAIARNNYFEEVEISSPPLSKRSRSYNEGIEVEKLLCAAAFYVNYESLVPRELGKRIIHLFIGNEKINLMLIAKIFIANFKLADENTISVAKDIFDTAQKGQLLDESIIQMIVEISEKEYV